MGPPDESRPEDDTALLARVGSGDQMALRALYAAYRPRLWRYLHQQLGGCPELVEEVLQDVFVAVWRSAAAFRGEARVATWLYRLAHNHAANARRAFERRGAGALVPFSEDPGASGEHPAYIGAAHDDEVADRLDLRAALHKLSPIHREALELVFVHGFSCDEAGRILGVPAGTIKSRLSHARRALSARLADPAPRRRHPMVEVPPFDCARCRDLLPDHVAGALPPAERSVLDAHLRGCPACAAELQRWRALQAALRADPVPSPPTPFDASWQRLATRLPDPAPLAGPPRCPPSPPPCSSPSSTPASSPSWPTAPARPRQLTWPPRPPRKQPPRGRRTAPPARALSRDRPGWVRSR